MPKELIYTCDFCGRQFKEPAFPNDSPLSEFRFSYKQKEEDNKYLTIYELKEFTNDSTIYLCEHCTKEFMKLLKSFGFKQLVSKQFFGENKTIKL